MIAERKKIVKFNTQYDIKSLSFQITEFVGDSPGLTEIEIYERRENVNLDFISQAYTSGESIKPNADIRYHFAFFIEQCSFEIERFFMRSKGKIVRDIIHRKSYDIHFTRLYKRTND